MMPGTDIIASPSVNLTVTCTTLITPFGRWRYTRAPQGFLSSGDGYNRRFDAILPDFERKERCVDDTIHYDTDLQTHWWRTIELLIRVGQAGIVPNADKFYFARRIVDFAGLILSENYRYVLLKHERYCERFLEIMLHVFIDILCIYVNMYSLICCVYTLIILALNNQSSFTTYHRIIISAN